MQYRCSECGQKGHNARTCKGRTASEPASELGTFKAGDKVRVSDLLPFYSGNSALEEYIGAEFVVESVDVDGSLSDTEGRRFGSHVFVFEKVNEKKEPKLKGESPRDIDVWTLIETVVPHNRTTLLYGPPGTGKTTAGQFAGNPAKVISVTLTEETPAAELRGHFVPKGNEFVWHHGPCVRAWLDGARLILNEVDKASMDCLTFLYAILDDESVSGIDLPNGEHVKPVPSFSVVATTNATPEDLPDGLQDRFRGGSCIFVPTPHPKAIASLPDDLIGPATKSFEGTTGLEGHRVSMREWLGYARLRDAVGEVYAARAIFGDNAEVLLNTLRIFNKSN